MKTITERAVITQYDEENNILNSIEITTPILIPESGEAIRNKLTGDIIKGRVGVGTNDSVENYEPILIEKE